ncbi:unnamed protein product, partial [Leptidea sinapis]
VVSLQDKIYRCEELEQARQELSSRLGPAPPQLALLKVDGCELPPESLACVTRVVGAEGAEAVLLQDVPGPLTREHLAGFTTLRRLNVLNAGTNVTEIPFDALSILPRLQRFTMTGAELRLGEASEEGASPLASLETLELGGGHVDRVGARTFSRAPRLTTLMMWGNKIRDIDQHAFEGVPLVVNVSLNSNGLPSLPDGLFSSTPRLQHLDLYDNAFSSLPAGLLQHLADLQEVLLFGNQVPLVVGGGLFSNLPSLTSVRLDNNDLSSLPADLFTNSTNIHSLDLSHNKLVTLPPGLLAHLALTDLDLSHNELTSLEQDLLSETGALERLDLSYNKLEVLPGGVLRSARALQYLSVAHNRITYLNESWVRGAGNLRELRLDHNQLTTLSAAALGLLPNLEILSASHNVISVTGAVGEVGAGEYSNVELLCGTAPLLHLRRLLLAYNRLERLCDDWRYRPSLQELDFSHNTISELNDADFVNSARVDLRYNNISRVSPPLATPPGEPAPVFMLDHNPYRCDCELFPVLRVLPGFTTKPLTLGEAACSSPPSLAGVKLLELDVERLHCDVPCAGCRCHGVPATSRLHLQCDTVPEVWPELPGGLRTAELELLRPPPGAVDLTRAPPYLRHA